MVLLLRITVGKIMAHVRVQSASTTLQPVICGPTELVYRKSYSGLSYYSKRSQWERQLMVRS